MSDKIAVSIHTALRMAWNEGLDTEPKMRLTYNRLMTMREASPGYYLADDVSKMIMNIKQELK